MSTANLPNAVPQCPLNLATLAALAPAAVPCVVWGGWCPHTGSAFYVYAYADFTCRAAPGYCAALQKEEVKQDAGLLNPQERVSAVRPMWEQRSHADRVDLLTVDLSSLKQEAEQQAEKARATAGGCMQQQQQQWVVVALSCSSETFAGCSLLKLLLPATWCLAAEPVRCILVLS